MTKTSTFFVILIVVLASIIGFRFLKESYKILPLSQKQPTNIDAFNFQEWHEFTSPTGKFKVLFPNLPQHATENIDDPKTNEKRKYDVYVSEKDDGTIFMISIITFPNTFSPDKQDALLKEVMNDMIASKPDNKLLLMEQGVYKGNPSLDYSIANDKITIDTKSFISSDSLYTLSRLTKPINYTRDEFLFFVNSFELTSPNQGAIPDQKK